MSTFMAKTDDERVEKRWLVIDATDQIVGRLAVVIANVLRGKHRPEYTPHIDTGEFVIVVNAEKIRFTGKKMETKIYDRYTGYPGGYRFTTPERLMVKQPEKILYNAVKRMVPRNRLGRKQLKKLKLYVGASHPHQAQQPVEFQVSV